MLTQANVNNVTLPRIRVLLRALQNSDNFRRFMATQRARRPLRDEEELLWMLMNELTRKPAPRRSMVKRLHGAIVNVRQRREWSELQRMLDKATSR